MVTTQVCYGLAIMAVYLVSWDLNKEKANYAQAREMLLTRIYEYDHIKDSGLDSVYFVSTTWSADQIYDDLRKSLDDNDRVIVTKLVQGSHQGWLSKNVWEWINARF